MNLPGLTWGQRPNPPQRAGFWAFGTASVTRQWREGHARGPIWFGRQRRREVVAMPTGLWLSVWAAAVVGMDADLHDEATARLRLSSDRTHLDAHAVAEATSRAGDSGHDAWVGTLQAHPSAVGDLAAVSQPCPELAGYLLAEEGNLAPIGDDLWRGILWTPGSTWVTVWHTGALLLLHAAPPWLELSLADGPTDPTENPDHTAEEG